MIGIVLAAGASTRLPNKILLPQRNAEPVIESAIDFCQEHCDCTDVVHGGGIVEAYLRTLGDVYDVPVHLTRQPEPAGVLDAIHWGVGDLLKAQYLITFADNIYCQEEEVPTEGRWASVRVAQRCGPSADQLDGWYGSDNEPGFWLP